MGYLTGVYVLLEQELRSDKPGIERTTRVLGQERLCSRSFTQSSHIPLPCEQTDPTPC